MIILHDRIDVHAASALLDLSICSIHQGLLSQRCVLILDALPVLKAIVACPYKELVLHLVAPSPLPTSWQLRCAAFVIESTRPFRAILMGDT